jgi:ArsR family transcriptional regulator
MEQTEAVEALAALAHQTRIATFRLLVQAGPSGLTAGAISDALDLPAPTLSFHLKELRQAGLVGSDRVGRSQIYRADYPAMSDLLTFLTDKCCEGVTECAPRPREATR